MRKKATDALKFRLWLYIVKIEDLKWKSEVHVLQFIRNHFAVKTHITHIIECIILYITAFNKIKEIKWDNS